MSSIGTFTYNREITKRIHISKCYSNKFTITITSGFIIHKKLIKNTRTSYIVFSIISFFSSFIIYWGEEVWFCFVVFFSFHSPMLRVWYLITSYISNQTVKNSFSHLGLKVGVLFFFSHTFIIFLSLFSFLFFFHFCIFLAQPYCIILYAFVGHFIIHPRKYV